METRRRSRILLKAALGSSRHRDDGAKGCLHSHSDEDSDTSESPSVHHSEIVNSLKGIGTHYNHTPIEMGWKTQKKTTSQPNVNARLDTRRVSTSHSSPFTKARHARARHSTVELISVPQHILDLDSKGKSDSFLSRASATASNHFEVRHMSIASDREYMDSNDGIQKFRRYSKDSLDDDVETRALTTYGNQKRCSSAHELSESAVGSDIKTADTKSAPFLSKLTQEDLSRHNRVQSRKSTRPWTAPDNIGRDHSLEKANTLSSMPNRNIPTSTPALYAGSKNILLSPQARSMDEIAPPTRPYKSHKKRRGQFQDLPMVCLPQPSKRESIKVIATRQSLKEEELKLEGLVSVNHADHFSEQESTTRTTTNEPLLMINRPSLAGEPTVNASDPLLHQKRLSMDADKPLRVVNTSPSTPSLESKQSLSASDYTRSSMSSTLMPLFTSSLRLRGSRSSSDTKWELGGESQLTSCFPDRHMRIFIVTWNMQEIKELPDNLDDLLLPMSEDVAADMYVVGTQESTHARKEWELLIQKTLGPYYVQVQSSAIGVIYLSLFIRRDLIWFCSTTRSATFATRPVTIIKTKGAVGISFTLFGSSFLFITSHFTASSSKVSERNSDMHRIASSLPLSDNVTSEEDVTANFDYVFWFGDLNYRVDLDRKSANKCLTKTDIMPLLLKDQLTTEILQGHAFGGFSEQPITFYPSYKFDPGTDHYDSSEKQRVPSWTDRVLFKSRTGAGITGCGYTCCHSIKYSDHRPVCAKFRVKLEPCLHVEGVPETVASFNRDMYVRANRERNMVLALAKASEELDSERVGVSGRRLLSNDSKGPVTSQFCIIL